MPRFYFHVRCRGETLSRDNAGLDFPDMVTAHDEALRAARDLDQAFIARGRDPRDCTIEVESAEGELVFSLSFAAIFNGHAAPLDPYGQAATRSPVPCSRVPPRNPEALWPGYRKSAILR